MKDRNISPDVIESLIEQYWSYERECMNSAMQNKDALTNRSRAALYRTVIADLEGLLPAPTLADILPEEHYDCVWREARSMLGEHFMIVRIWKDKCKILWADGSVTLEKNSDVIPLMDKPRGIIPWADV